MVAFDQASVRASDQAFDRAFDRASVQAFVQAYQVLDRLLVAYRSLVVDLALKSVAFLASLAFGRDLLALDHRAFRPLEVEHPLVVDLAFEAYHLSLNLEAFVVHSVVLVV